jgi:hypothetical protein
MAGLGSDDGRPGVNDGLNRFARASGGQADASNARPRRADDTQWPPIGGQLRPGKRRDEDLAS